MNNISPFLITEIILICYVSMTYIHFFVEYCKTLWLTSKENCNNIVL